MLLVLLWWPVPKVLKALMLLEVNEKMTFKKQDEDQKEAQSQDHDPFLMSFAFSRPAVRQDFLCSLLMIFGWQVCWQFCVHTEMRKRTLWHTFKQSQFTQCKQLDSKWQIIFFFGYNAYSIYLKIIIKLSIILKHSDHVYCCETRPRDPNMPGWEVGIQGYPPPNTTKKKFFFSECPYKDYSSPPTIDIPAYFRNYQPYSTRPHTHNEVHDYQLCPMRRSLLL